MAIGPFLAFLLALGGAPASASEAAARAKAEVEAGRTALGAGNTQAAIERFRAALRLEPGNAAAHNALGSILNSSGRYAEALPHALAAVRSDPSNPRYRYNRGLVLAEHGRFKEAIADFDLALAAHPEMAYAWLERGAAKLSLDDLAGARADWRQAAAVEPKLIWVRWYEATGDFVAGDYARAAGGFDAVAQAEPGFVPAHLWRTLSHLRAGSRLAVPQPTSSEWPAPIMTLLRGEVGATDLLAAAADGSASGDQRRLGEAHFAMAIQSLGKGDQRSARQSLKRALAVKAPRHVWKIAAERELARLG